MFCCSSHQRHDGGGIVSSGGLDPSTNTVGGTHGPNDLSDVLLEESENPDFGGADDRESHAPHSRHRKGRGRTRRCRKASKQLARSDSWKLWGEDGNALRGLDGQGSTQGAVDFSDEIQRYPSEALDVAQVTAVAREDHGFNGTGSMRLPQAIAPIEAKGSCHSDGGEIVAATKSSYPKIVITRSEDVSPRARHAEQTEPGSPHALSNQLHNLSDNLGKLLLTLRPQVMASRQLEAELCALQANIKHMCCDAGTPHLSSDLAMQQNFKLMRPKPIPLRQSDASDVSNPMNHLASSEASAAHRAFAGLDFLQSQPTGRDTRRSRRARFAIGRNRKALIPDIEEIKQHVREGAQDACYCVTQKYHTSGICQWIARSHWFDIVSLVVIILNAIWAAIDADYNEAETLYDSALSFQVAENFFCTYFFLELLVRFGAFRLKRDCWFDSWFCFDAVMLCMMVFETWILFLFMSLSWWKPDAGSDAHLFRLARLLRLCRIAKVSRVVLAVPELAVLISGLTVGCRAVAASMTFTGVIIYVFAILFRQLARDTDLEDKFFASVPASMATLLLTSVLPDHVDYFTEDFGVQPIYLGVLYFMFIMFVAYVVLNLLVGVLVNVATMVSSQDHEEMRMHVLREELMEMLESVGVHDASKITSGQFHALVIVPGFCDVLRDAGVDAVGLIENAQHTLQTHDGEIEVGALLELVLQLRGTNVATVRDLVDFRRLVSREFHRLEDRLMAPWMRSFPADGGVATK